MTQNIFNKDIWNPKDWDIFIGNLELLRRHNNLKKQDLNNLLGVWNVYRRDIQRPGRGTVLSICHKFSVTEDWLGTDHSSQTESYALKGVNMVQPTGRPPVNTGLLADCIEVVEKVLQEKKKKWPPAKKARFIALQYEYYLDSGKDIDYGEVVTRLRLVS